MIGLDTNVLLRLVTRDDPVQCARVEAMLDHVIADGATCYISLIVMVEFVWTLKRSYRYSDADVIRVVVELLLAKHLVVESGDEVAAAAANLARHRGDFSDMLIAAMHRKAGCLRTVTFDENFIRSGLAEPC